MCTGRYITYGLSPDADVYAADIKKGFMTVSFDVMYKGENLGAFSLPVPGVHNILNSLAAIIVARELKIEAGLIKEALKNSAGYRGDSN